MRTTRCCCLVAALLLALPLASAASGRGRSAPELGPLVSGTASYLRGAFVWTDYVFDDRGANLVEAPDRGAAPGEPARSGGDATYPEWAAPANTADLVQLQIARERGSLTIRALLQTLVDPSLPVLGVAFDTDATPTTGARELPGGAWPALDPLGVDLLVVVSAEGTELHRYEAGAWRRVARYAAQIDAAANLVEARLPRRALPRLRGHWRAFGVLGLRNPETGGSWLDGREAIYDLAFVGDEAFVRWQENRQADVLAGALSSREAAAWIDLDKLRRRRTELADARRPGFHTYLHHSALELSEGIRFLDGAFESLGPYQPYLVWIPPELPAENSLILWLHGAGQNHLQSNFPGGTYIGTGRVFSEDLYLVRNFLSCAFPEQQTGPPTIQIYPFGRRTGIADWIGTGQIDALEALDDAMGRFGTDPDRVVLQGASAGGIGAYRLATHYPDRFAAVFPVIGSGLFVRHLFENLRNVPVWQMNGALDIFPFFGPPSEEDADRLEELGYEYRYWLLKDRGHEICPIQTCVLGRAVDAKRDPDPAHVVFHVEPADFEIDPARGLRIAPERAYWASAIRPRDEARASVDLRSHALPAPASGGVPRREHRDNFAGGDLCGPNPDLPLPADLPGDEWLERSRVPLPAPAQPRENRIEGELRNLASLALDLRRAGFRSRSPGRLALHSDGPLELRLTGLAPGTRIRLDGRRAGTVAGARSARLQLGGGAHDIALSPPADSKRRKGSERRSKKRKKRKKQAK